MKQKLSLVVSKINHYLAVGSRMHITKNSFLLKKEFFKNSTYIDGMEF